MVEQSFALKKVNMEVNIKTCHITCHVTLILKVTILYFTAFKIGVSFLQNLLPKLAIPRAFQHKYISINISFFISKLKPRLICKKKDLTYNDR